MIEPFILDKNETYIRHSIRLRRLASLIIIFNACIACDDEAQTQPEPADIAGGSVGPEAGSSAGDEAGTTAGVEAGDEAGTPAGVEAGDEAGTPAGVEAGDEAGTPAGVEAGDEAGDEAGTPAGVEAGDEAGDEAGTPAGVEAGDEAGTPAGVEAGAEAGEDVMMEATRLTGLITNPGGVGVEGIRVSVYGQEALSQADGRYELTLPAGLVQVLFEGQGYLSTRHQSRISEGHSTILNVVLYPEEAPVTLNIDQGGVVENERGARVEIGVGSLVNQRGEPVSGDVNVSLTAINPLDRDEAVIVSNNYFAQQADGTFTILESFGMVDITIRDLEGNKLQVAPNQTLRLTIPVPDYKQCLNTVGFWSFDDEMSWIWREEGEAQCTELEGRCTCTGEISHMSYWNLDEPNSPTCIKGRLVDSNQNPRVGVTISANGSRSSSSRTTTDLNGEFALVVGIDEIVSIFIEGVLLQDNINTMGGNIIDVDTSTFTAELSPEQIAQCQDIGALSMEEAITEELSCPEFCELSESCMRPMNIPYNACLTICASGLPFPECILGEPACDRINLCLGGRQNENILCTQACTDLVDCGLILENQDSDCLTQCRGNNLSTCLANSVMCEQSYDCFLNIPEDCDNQMDDDLDGLIDCGDDECAQELSCLPPESCNNGIDDDLDGLVDCEDDECAQEISCLPTEACNNGIDDDQDNLIDCSDPDCLGTAESFGVCCIDDMNCNGNQFCQSNICRTSCLRWDPMNQSEMCNDDAGCSQVDAECQSGACYTDIDADRLGDYYDCLLGGDGATGFNFRASLNYLYAFSRIPWGDASEVIGSVNSSFPIITDVIELNEIADLVGQDEAWTGLTKDNRGAFLWPDGTQYTPINNVNIEDVDAGDCVTIASGPTLRAQPCSAPKGFVLLRP